MCLAAREAFAARMNARAAELGADAHFVNPHGLDADGHEASALALARIFRQAMQNGDFRRITGTKKTTIPWVGNDFSRVLVSKKPPAHDLCGRDRRQDRLYLGRGALPRLFR